ncbi:MAG: Cytochrome c family protein [Rhodanobacteraceae bacterium]|jgi:mono/diheme cytochrome c family protein|nr:MAG: Cytochrome c family protein [Rhodanobacteraceae bacterium]
MRFVGALIVWILIAIIAFFVFAYSGMYQVGADVPHWKITRQAIGMVREHAIDRRVADIKPPPLDDPALVKEGAEHYSEMCVDCHLAPGVADSELRDGLNPRPPNLTRFAPHPAEAFWIIKHGLKMTAMPAWGKTHDDQKIWALVAYLQKQPKMSAAEFHALTANAAEEEGHEHAEMAMPAAASSSH